MIMRVVMVICALGLMWSTHMDAIAKEQSKKSEAAPKQEQTSSKKEVNKDDKKDESAAPAPCHGQAAAPAVASDALASVNQQINDLRSQQTQLRERFETQQVPLEVAESQAQFDTLRLAVLIMGIGMILMLIQMRKVMKRLPPEAPKDNEKGFSLIEISIVLVIVATILASVLPTITEGTKIKATEETTERMQAIEEAIQAYYATNAALPCPADITLAVNVANFGRRAANANCNGGTPDANFGPVSNVTGGGVPTKDLGLPDEYAFDGWGRRIAYHVDTRATVVASFNTAGAITVNDDTGTARSTTGVYALISSGRNGHGGFTRGGASFNAGSTNTHELANCGIGAAPCAPAYDAVLVQKMEQSDDPADPTDKFDDIVVYKLLGHITGGGGGGSDATPTGAVMAFDLVACPTGWTEYTVARGRFLRGIDNGAGNDPSGTRAPGNVQADEFRSHTHDAAVSPVGAADTTAWAYSGVMNGMTTGAAGGAETRPKNVAVLFCRKN